MPPNRVPMLSTGRRQTTTIKVAATSTTIEPGTRFTNLRKSKITTTDDAANTAEGVENVCRWLKSACTRPTKSPGTFPIFKPKKSLICVLAIKTAMPLVKPTVTGRGMNFTIDPSPLRPSTKSITPAIIVQTSSPLSPCWLTIPNTTTTYAPVGPPICVFEPPRAEIRNPATTAVYKPAWGVTPDDI